MRDCLISDLRLELWFLWMLFVLSVASSDNSTDEEEAVPVGGPDEVRVLRAPTTIVHNMKVHLEYRCRKPSVIGAGIHVWSEAKDRVQVFATTWKCYPIYLFTPKVIRIKLPRYIAYAPSHLNRYSAYSTISNFVAWVLDPVKYAAFRHNRTWFDAADVKLGYKVHFLEPFDRPKRPETWCLSWWKEIKSQFTYCPTCSWEPDTVHAVSSPVLLTGGPYGVHRALPAFTSKFRRAIHQHNIKNPRFSLYIVLYIEEYCQKAVMCSVFQRVTWEDQYLTPLISITTRGRLHIQYANMKGDSHAFLPNSSFVVPSQQWIRIYVAYEDHVFRVGCQYGPEFRSKWELEHIVPENHQVYFDDSVGTFALGGSELSYSFTGYVADAVIYRDRLLSLQQLPQPPPASMVFKKRLEALEGHCQEFVSWLEGYTEQWLPQRLYRRSKESCRNTFLDFLLWLFDSHANRSLGECVPGRTVPRHYRLAGRKARQTLAKKVKLQMADLGDVLYRNVTETVERDGLAVIPKLMPLLKQSSCCGNHDATFLYFVILTNGINVKANPIQARPFLLHGVRHAHRLSVLSLAHKYMLGLDGLPEDKEMAYMYYREVAEHTKMDKLNHTPDDVMTEHVRLTDEAALSQQTEENGDLFLWIQHQASQGVVSAQKNMARLLYWGAQGINRNVKAAVDFYKMGAQSDDPVAQYDYGIVLLKGHGVEQNVKEAVNQFKRSAAKGDHRSLNALGWYELEKKHNAVKAMELFEAAEKMGNADAAFNLGHMYMHGRTPDKKKDRILAFKYLSKAATHGQTEAGICVGMFNIRGHPNAPRNAKIAAEWGRFISEQNQAVGKVLNTALKAYRNLNWILVVTGPAALVNYHVAAETGVEVATFNLGYLCELNMEGLVSYIENECMWRNYNLSIHGPPSNVNSYALIKMGDYHWYSNRTNNISRAVAMYGKAAAKADPQGLYNLAFLAEQGVQIPYNLVWTYGVHRGDSNSTIAAKLYTRCKDSPQREAHIACLLALWRLYLTDIWNRYQLLLQCSGFIGVVVTSSVLATSLYALFRGRHLPVYTV